MNNDATLLRRYVEEGSDASFTEVVRHNVDLVYGAALRRTGGDPHRAADVAQEVFTRLARQARKLSHHAALGAWLHTATRNAALNLMISEQRRKAREFKSLELAPAGGPEPHWDQVRPLLDAAIDELPENDRTTVILRFLERRPFAEIGAALAITEDAARMRTDRALDKLRILLARRGITSSGAALGAMVASQPAVAVPAGLAVTLAAKSLATAAAGAGVFLTLASFMNLKIIATAVVAASASFLLGAYLSVDRPNSPLPLPDVPRQSQLIASLRWENSRLMADVDRLNAALAALPSAPPIPAARLAEMPPKLHPEGQRAILNNLRQIAAARDQYEIDKGRLPTSVRDLVGVGRYIKQTQEVAGEDYYGLLMVHGGALSVTTEDGTTVTYDPSGRTTTRIPMTPAMARAAELRRRSEPATLKAVEAYRAAHNGDGPSDPRALLSYFTTPQDAADFLEYLEAEQETWR